MINTIVKYRMWLDYLKQKLSETAALIPEKGREGAIYGCASKLNLSHTTIKNYIAGTGTNPETAILILEELNKSISEQQNS